MGVGGNVGVGADGAVGREAMIAVAVGVGVGGGVGELGAAGRAVAGTVGEATGVRKAPRAARSRSPATRVVMPAQYMDVNPSTLTTSSAFGSVGLAQKP